MKNDELYVMKKGLDSVPEKVSYLDEKKKGIVNFKFAVSKNKRILNNHIKDVEAAVELTEKYKEYRKKEQELSKKFCRRDKDGKNVIIPVIEGQQMGEKFDIIGVDDPGSEYSLEFEKLNKEYEKEIDERTEQMEKFNAFLKDESDFKPYLIPFEWLPDDLPQKAMDGVLYIIDPNSLSEEKAQSNKKKRK